MRKPFVWTHPGYQLTCIDGLGWFDGAAAPLTPWASFVHHCRVRRRPRVIVEGLKLALRRWVAHAVTLNVAISEWVRMRQPLPRQIVIYNPFPLSDFVGPEAVGEKFDFLFVGRLVSEKGVMVLLSAFRRLLDESGSNYSLVIVGDGPLRDACESTAGDLGLMENVSFLGQQTGAALKRLVLSSRIGVVPSVYEEPMGGVAIEMMKAGIPVIVSRRGGLTECVGEAGITFANGDGVELADLMGRLATNGALRAELARRASRQALLFDETELTQKYIQAYEVASCGRTDGLRTGGR